VSLSSPTKALAEVCEIKPPKSEAKRKLNDADPVSFVPMEDLGIDQKYLAPNSERKLGQVAGGYTYFAEGDVLLAKITPCFENGKLGIAKGLTNGVGFGSSEYIVFRPSRELSNEYLYYFLAQDSFRTDGIRTMSGAVGHKRVSKEFVERYQIPVPPISQQQRIVAILDEAFAGLATATANAKKNLKNARELFENHLNFLFAQKKAGWTGRKLSDLVDVTHGFAFDGKYFVDGDGDYPILLTPGNFTEVGSLDFNERNTKRFTDDVSQNFVLRKGDLVVVMTDLSSKMKILGKPAFVDRDGIL
jgi:type I restriction enzyme S subunit